MLMGLLIVTHYMKSQLSLEDVNVAIIFSLHMS